MDNDVEKRLVDIEKVLEKLMNLEEGLSKQLLEVNNTLSEFRIIVIRVEQNSRDIRKIEEILAEFKTEIVSNKKELNKKLVETSSRLNNKGHKRLLIGLGIAVLFISSLSIYFYFDVVSLEKKITTFHSNTKNIIDKVKRIEKGVDNLEKNLKNHQEKTEQNQKHNKRNINNIKDAK